MRRIRGAIGDKQRKQFATNGVLCAGGSLLCLTHCRTLVFGLLQRRPDISSGAGERSRDERDGSSNPQQFTVQKLRSLPINFTQEEQVVPTSIYAQTCSAHCSLPKFLPSSPCLRLKIRAGHTKVNV